MRRLLVVVLTTAACGQDPYATSAPPAKATAPASAGPTMQAPAQPDTKATPAAPDAAAKPAAPDAAAKPQVAEPSGEDLTLTPEEERLLAADIKTLAPEERRKRAFAQRKRILQNPDSPVAKTLEDLRRAAENGGVEPPAAPATKPDKGLHFEAKTKPNP